MKNHVLEKLLQGLKENLDHLRQKESVSLERYLNDWEVRRIVERELQLAIQTVIDMGARIIAQKRLGAPENAKAIFHILLENDLIEAGLSQKLQELVDFRNELVHEYRDIDNPTVYSYLHKAPSALKSFGELIAKLLERL